MPKPGVRAIQIDIDPQALGRNYPLEAAVLGDAKTALARMLEHADPSSAERRHAWLRTTSALRDEWFEKVRPRPGSRRSRAHGQRALIPP